MFILKRQDVEIINVQNPQNPDQQVPILKYQGQTFRLLNMFGDNRDEALALWRDLTDNKGKACVLLEEPQRFSVWGRVKFDQMPVASAGGGDGAIVCGGVLMLQTIYAEVEDFLGNRQAGSFKQDLVQIMQKGALGHGTPEAINALLTDDPLSSMQLPPWDENKVQFLLGELHTLASSYFGGTGFVANAVDVLNDMSGADQAKFIGWLKSTPKGKLWQ
ncbi:MAG: Npun_F0813 family protein [Pseudanabaena sp. ELA607]|jgi:hypothetical protein